MNNYSILYKSLENGQVEVTLNCSWVEPSHAVTVTPDRVRAFLESFVKHRQDPRPVESPATPSMSQTPTPSPAQPVTLTQPAAAVRQSDAPRGHASALPVAGEKRKRGRPSKAELAARIVSSIVSGDASPPDVNADDVPPLRTDSATSGEKRKRGRPSKAELAARAAAVVTAGAGLVDDTTTKASTSSRPQPPSAKQAALNDDDGFDDVEEEELEEDELAEPDDDDDDTPTPATRPTTGTTQQPPARQSASRKWDDDDDDDVSGDDDEDDEDEDGDDGGDDEVGVKSPSPGVTGANGRKSAQPQTSGSAVAGWLPSVSEEDTPNFAAAIEHCVKQCVDKGVRDPSKVKDLTIKAVQKAGYTKYTKVPAFTDYVSPLILRKLEKFVSVA